MKEGFALARTIIMTGATGFLGKAVALRLVAAGDRVIGLARDPKLLPLGVIGIQTDLRDNLDPVLHRFDRADVILHLAQASGWHQFPNGAGDIAAVALAATARLAEFGTRVGAQSFLYASSGGIYGPSTAPLTEASPQKPSSQLGFYLSSKAAGETVLSYFKDQFAIQILRFFFIYGPGQTDEFLLPRLIRSVKSGTPVIVSGDRGTRLNPIFVTDAAEAVLRALGLEKSLTANIAGTEIVTIRQITEEIGRLLNVTPVFADNGKPPDDYVADITRMLDELGGPTTSIADGINAILSAR